jgi:hypothetical protein
MTANRQIDPRVRRRGTRLRAALRWLPAVGLLALAGCLLPVAAMEKMFPKDRVAPRFAMPARKTVLVFPDDVARPLSYPPVKRRLAEKVNELLIEKGLAARTVPYDRLVELRGEEPNFDRMHVPTVGRRCGAELVVHIAIDRLTLKETPIETLWRGRFEVRVKVVDVKKGRIWPDELAGLSVSVQEPTTENTSETYGAELSRKLADKLAVKIAGLFHAHLVDRHKPKDTKPILE